MNTLKIEEVVAKLEDGESIHQILRAAAVREDRVEQFDDDWLCASVVAESIFGEVDQDTDSFLNFFVGFVAGIHSQKMLQDSDKNLGDSQASINRLIQDHIKGQH